VVNEAAPAVINVVFKLPFINMIIYFSTDSLHSSAGVNLSEGALQIVPIAYLCIINGNITITLNICSIEYAELFPFLNIFAKVGWNVKDRQNLVITWFSFECFFELRWEGDGGCKV
jgi:hypothetical protein